MAVCIRLSRGGRVHLPFYHIGVFDRRTRRDGRPVEALGLYAPESEKEPFRIKLDRVEYWLAQGADVSPTVAALLRKAGFKAAPKAKAKASKPKVSHGKKNAEAAKARKVKKRSSKRTANSKVHAERKNKAASA